MEVLPTVLSVTAGSADVISFLGLGSLFVAHITGNLVILAAHIVAGGEAPLLSARRAMKLTPVSCLPYDSCLGGLWTTGDRWAYEKAERS